MVEWYGGASRLGWLNGMEVLHGWDGCMVWRCFKVGMVEWYGGPSRLNGIKVKGYREREKKSPSFLDSRI